MFEADFSRVNGISVDDHLHYDTPTPTVMLGMIQWVQKTFVPENCPRITLLLSEYTGVALERTLDGATEYQAIYPDACLYRYAASCVWPEFADKFKFLCMDQNAMRAAYAHVLNRDVIGIPHYLVAMTRKKLMPKLRNLNVGFLGAHRPGRGFESVGKIVEILADRHPDLHFIVQDSRLQLIQLKSTEFCLIR